MSSTEIPKPLSDFNEIGHNTYIYTPEKYAPQSAPLILLFAWNAAAAKHIAKYTVTYRELMPNARILLVRCWTSDVFRSTSKYRTLAQPLLNTVKEHVGHGGQVLCHSFSNGGGNQAVEFAKVWRESEGTLLPIRCQILDSSPTKGAWARSHAAICAALPQTWFWSVAVHLLLVVVFCSDVILRKDPKWVTLCRELNETTLFNTSVPRVYLYSKVDRMVGYDEVEEHADLARRKGWDVTMVRFENSSHCGHIREDETRYWDAVMKAWAQGRR